MTTPNNTVAGLAEKLRAMLDDVDAVKLRPEGFVQGVRALLALASPAPSAPPPVAGGLQGFTQFHMDNWTDDDFKQHIPAVREALQSAIRRLSTAEQPGSAVQGEAVWMFKSDGAWHTFVSEKHRIDTIADGRWDVRQFFTTQPPAPAAEQGAKDWFCATCSNTVDPSAVTFDERHDSRVGGCGMPVTYGMPSTQPEARGVEGMVLVPRELLADVEEQLVDLFNEKSANRGIYREREKLHDADVLQKVRLLLAATPNPVRAEQPEGKGKLVPVEPTEEMLRAAYPYHWNLSPGRDLAENYRLMLAAAPDPDPEPRAE